MSNRWYQLVSCDNTVAKPLVVGDDDLRFDPEKALVSEPLENLSDGGSLLVENPADEGEPDDVLQNHLGLAVYSERLRRALDEAGVRGIQYIPVNVVRFGGEVITGFCIANVLEKRAARDVSKSKIQRFPDDYFLVERRGCIRDLRQPVLCAEALRACDVLRLEEYPVTVYVSGRFKNAFEENHCTGYSFSPVGLT